MENFKLKAALVERFGTQVAAARAIGLSEWRLSRIIRGWDEPSEGEKAALSRVLGGRVVKKVLRATRPAEGLPA